MLKGVKQLSDYLKNYSGGVVGLGNTAFLRTGLIFLVGNYQIICIQESADLESIRKSCPVLSIERDFGKILPEKLNTSSLLANPQVKKYLKSLPQGCSFLVYKSTPKTEKAIEEIKGKLLANKSEISIPFEDKKEFRKIAKEAELALLPGETLKINEFSRLKFKKCQKELGESLVFQLTDYRIGGGVGTVFVNNLGGFQEFLEFVKRRRQEGKDLKWVNVTSFTKGDSASIIGMITREGILSGPLQMQLTDIPEITAFHGRNGVFCGHDWLRERFNQKQQHQAESLVATLGSFMAEKGYKGMFGLDVIIDRKKDKVYPIECNARYTGAFPVYSMLQLEAGEPSFDLFQLAEFLELDYSFDFEKVQKKWRQSKTGAQLILHNQTRRWIKIKGSLPAGVYEFKNKKIFWLRDGFAIQDIGRPETEFVLTDGAVVKDTIKKPGQRLGRVLFKHSITSVHNQINERTREIVEKIYQGLEMEKIKGPVK